MDSIQTNTTSGSLWQLLTPLPLSVLAWLELRALRIEYAALVKISAAADQWYVFRDGVTEGPEKLGEIFQRLIGGQSGLAVLHESEAGAEDPHWQLMSYQSWCKNPVTSTLWVSSFWGLAVLFGWVLVCSILPFPLRGFGQGAYGLGLLAFAGATLSPKFRMKLSRWHKPKLSESPDEDGEPAGIPEAGSGEEQ